MDESQIQGINKGLVDQARAKLGALLQQQSRGERAVWQGMTATLTQHPDVHDMLILDIGVLGPYQTTDQEYRQMVVNVERINGAFRMPRMYWIEDDKGKIWLKWKQEFDWHWGASVDQIAYSCLLACKFWVQIKMAINQIKAS